MTPETRARPRCWPWRHRWLLVAINERTVVSGVRPSHGNTNGPCHPALYECEICKARKDGWEPKKCQPSWVGHETDKIPDGYEAKP